MTTRSSKRRTTIASAIVLSAMLATPVLAAAPAKKPAAKPLPAIEETIVVTEVDLKPITMASRIMKSDAYMKDGTKIGDVSNIVLDEKNKATAVIVGVGGFLGMDETHVAIPMSKITLENKGGTMKVIADVTKAELKKAEKSS